MASPSPAPASRRPTDLQRSAFWIYGVTAMVMREPFGTVIRHATDAGLGNWQVRVEILRIAVILVLLARLFLVSGLYFETVYMRPDSSSEFPRRSYPTDFLAGLAQFLVGAAATTAIATHTRLSYGLSPFTIIIAVFLLVDALWLAIALARRFTSVMLIRGLAVRNVGILVMAAVIRAVAVAAGANVVLAEELSLLAILVGAVLAIARQIRRYEALES